MSFPPNLCHLYSTSAILQSLPDFLHIYLNGGTIFITKDKGMLMSDHVAYCVKCKEKRTMKDAQVVTNDKGRRQAKGTCPECGTKMNLFLKSEK